ncbi:MAG TPA: hypothetical protein VF746_24080 [Longimicrobium sp.]|jgi:hypothetical protein
MDAKESEKRETLSRVAQEIGSVIRRQAHRKWDTVRMAERNEGRRHVWKFQSGPDRTDRFLAVTHEAMVQGEDAAPLLLEQLKAGGWLDRLHEGPETALILSKGGHLETWARQ